MSKFFFPDLSNLSEDVVRCTRCPRLVKYIGEIREKFPTYWCKPVPGFGDPNAKIMLLGLAPGRYGSNRTGRMFTGDSSGKFLYRALYELGLANQPDAVDQNDGLELTNTYITAMVRCAPPQNKPTKEEINLCSNYVKEEIELLPQLKIIVALGKIAHDGYLKILGEKLSQYKFKHGAVHTFKDKPTMVDIYHPSRQNTQTGLLTMKMFKEVLSKAIKLSQSHSI